MHRRCVLIFSWVIQQKNDARHDINLLFEKKKIMIVTDVYLLQYVFIADFGMLNSLLAYEIYKEHKKMLELVYISKWTMQPFYICESSFFKV